MKKVISIYVESEFLELMSTMSVNRSELINSLLAQWSQSDKAPFEQLVKDLREAENQAAISQARVRYLKTQVQEYKEAEKRQKREEYFKEADAWVPKEFR